LSHLKEQELDDIERNGEHEPKTRPPEEEIEQPLEALKHEGEEIETHRNKCQNPNAKYEFPISLPTGRQEILNPNFKEVLQLESRLGGIGMTEI
jgi:hypothetical protein